MSNVIVIKVYSALKGVSKFLLKQIFTAMMLSINFMLYL